MNFKKTRKVISKLTTLMDSFESIGEELSDIEISLLEKYIDDIKESLPRPVKEEVSNEVPVKIETSKESKPLPQTKKREEVELLEPKLEPKKEVIVEEPEIISEEAQVNLKEEIVEKTDIVEKVSEVETPQVIEKVLTKTPSNEKFNALFTKVEVKELSDRLKWKPIEDIDKSLSINERILTKNELFDGDADLMNATIATLNSFKSYDEAIEYLKNNVALKLDWISDSKKGKALLFLQKVQRRYM